MSSKVKCPVCGSQLQSVTKKHIDSKKHQEALKKKGIPESQDPTLEILDKKSQKKEVKKHITGEIDERVVNLEKTVNLLKENQEMILKMLESINLKESNYMNKTSLKPKYKLKIEDIQSAINRCVQNNNNKSLWVKIDDVISILKLNREEDRNNFDKIVIKMFNKNIVDLAEGGDPKYPLNYQNREYGMVALQ